MPCKQLQHQVKQESSLEALILVADIGGPTNQKADSFTSMCLALVPAWNVAKSK